MEARWGLRQVAPGEGYACSRPCGGGLYEMRRNVIAQVEGGRVDAPRT